MHRRPLFWLAALAACGSGADAMEGARAGAEEAPRPSLEAPVDVPDAAHGPDVPYSEAIQKSSHNSYERAEPLLDQLVYHRIRSLEIDVHRMKANAPAAKGDWFVFHEDAPFLRDTSCVRASDCLAQLAAFHAAVPRHEVVTLFVDLKDGFSDGHTPADLDALLVRSLGRSALFTPVDAMDRCPFAASLEDALAGTCTFPTLDELRGRVLVAVTGGSACDPASHVNVYGGGSPAEHLAFAAPGFGASCPVSSQDGKPNAAVFANMSWEARAQAAEARSRGLVARIYSGGISGGLNTAEELGGARAAGANHLATDKVSFEEDAWSKTHGPRGFPFECEGCEDLAEPADIVGIRAISGDLWGTADSAFLAYDEAVGAETWTALVSVPSSHVEPFAKACLVARASEAPGAAYVAVCRPFDANAPRMQIRATSGAETSAIVAPEIAGHGPDVPAMLRLVIVPGGGETTVRAETSADGAAWVAIGTTVVDADLPVRGLAVSSHEARAAKALFTAITRSSPGGPTSRVSAASLPVAKPIGTAQAGEVFAGVFP